jgi:alcohol dehydrogenase class IV
MAQFGARRVLILTDPRISGLGIPDRVADSLARYGISSEIFDGVHVEPTDDSMDKAVGYAREQGPWAGFVAVGGGSSIDTAKAVNLLTTDEGALMDYINKPIGGGRAPQRQLKPLIAVAFRFTFATAPERHLRAAALLAPGQETLNDPAEQLPSAVTRLMRDIGINNGIGAVGYTEADIGDLVPGTMKQQRLLATCARPVTEEDIAGIFAASIQNW